jgi:hypothetical protein
MAAILFYFILLFLRHLIMLPRLASNYWAQLTLLTQPPSPEITDVHHHTPFAAAFK